MKILALGAVLLIGLTGCTINNTTVVQTSEPKPTLQEAPTFDVVGAIVVPWKRAANVGDACFADDDYYDVAANHRVIITSLDGEATEVANPTLRQGRVVKEGECLFAFLTSVTSNSTSFSVGVEGGPRDPETFTDMELQNNPVIRLGV